MDGLFNGMRVNVRNTELKFVFPVQNKSDKTEESTDSQHIHFDIEIHFILSGQYILMHQNNETLLTQNTICIIPKGEIHQIKTLPQSDSIFNMLISIHPKRTDNKNKILSQVWNSISKIEIFENCDYICKYIRDFQEFAKKTDNINEDIKSSLVTIAFCLITDKLQKQYFSTSKLAKACKITCDGSFFDNELDNFLMSNYGRKLSKEEVAKHIGISTAQLGRIIKRNYGMSYSSLITALRMSEAKRLMEKDETLTNIAKNLGYTSYNGFATAFKRYYGDSPENTRKSMKIKT